MISTDLSKTDALALERTRLANERTFLAYFRTSIVFLSSGFAMIKLDVLNEMIEMGYFLLAISPLIAIMGVLRFFYVKRKLKRFYCE